MPELLDEIKLRRKRKKSWTKLAEEKIEEGGAKKDKRDQKRRAASRFKDRSSPGKKTNSSPSSLTESSESSGVDNWSREHRGKGGGGQRSSDNSQ